MPITTARQLITTVLLLRDRMMEPTSSLPVRPSGRSSSRRITPRERGEPPRWHSSAGGAPVRMPPWLSLGSARHRSSSLKSRRKAKGLFGDQRGEQGEQIEDGNTEETTRVRLTHRVPLMEDAHAGDREPAAAQDIGAEIERAGKTEQHRRKSAEHDESSIDGNLTPCRVLALDDREHGNTRARIIVGSIERQRPEVRRCPEKDDRHEHKRLDRQGSGDRGPADRGRKRSGQAPDNDVL